MELCIRSKQLKEQVKLPYNNLFYTYLHQTCIKNTIKDYVQSTLFVIMRLIHFIDFTGCCDLKSVKKREERI